MFNISDVVNFHNYKIPNYPKLVEFLVEPLLESPKSLSVDCEKIKSSQKGWIRLAINEVDKGRVYGKGGRNIQAIRTILITAASTVGQSLYLDIYNKLNKNTYS